MSIRRLLAAVVVCTGMIVLSHSAAFAQGTPLFAVLLGGSEVSGGGQANAGDPTAFGSATVIFRGTDTICWAILVSGFDATRGAHIHGAKAGLNGLMRVSLVAPMNNAGEEGHVERLYHRCRPDVRGDDQEHQGQPDLVLHQRPLGRVPQRRPARPAVLV